MKLPQPPFTTWLLEGKVASKPWGDWFTTIWNAINATTRQLGLVTAIAQQASIGATAIPAPTLTTGRYRVRWYTRVTQAASVSSSLQVTVGWTDGGVAQSASGASLTGNTTTTYESGGVSLFTADTATTVTYAAAYGSVGGTPMQFALTVALEAVP